MEIHFIDVGCGNMTLLLFPEGTTYLYDCNVTDENEDAVLAYLSKAMGDRTAIDVFVCSHRHADHMRGLRKVHEEFPIGIIKDPGVAGTTTDSDEYLDYMKLRREIGSGVIEAKTFKELEGATIRWMNAADDSLSDTDDQSVVMKVEYKGSSALLAGDTSFRPWKELMLPFYSDEKLQADILLAAHHGSATFFDDPNDEKNYYVKHIKTISPDMTIISVGPNVHGLPDDKAVELYEKYSNGSKNGNKAFTTEDKGNIKLVLKGEGHWNLNVNQ